MTSHKQRGGIRYALFCSVSSRLCHKHGTPALFKKKQGLFAPWNDMSENLKNNEKQVVTNWENEYDKAEDSVIPIHFDD